MNTLVATAAHSQVIIDKSGVIVATIRGPQTVEVIREIEAKIVREATALRLHHKRVMVLTDVTGLRLSDTNSAVRSEGKRLLDRNKGLYDAWAVFGNGPMMALASYLIRVGGLAKRARIFSSERKARAWLTGPSAYTPNQSAVSLVAGVVIMMIGTAGLYGWRTDNMYLTSWLPSLRPINPLEAVGLVAFGLGFCFYWLGKMRALKVVGVFGVLLGIIGLTPAHFDHILFRQQVEALLGHADFARSAARCFVLAGLTPFTVGTNRRAVRIIQYVLASLIMVVSLFNIFGQLYAHDFIYRLNGNYVMSLNLAIAFLIAGITLFLLVVVRQVGNVLTSISRVGWLIVVAMIFVQMATYAAWSQLISRDGTNASQAFVTRTGDMQDVLNQRLQAYIQGLNGFQGLFAASKEVNQGEFQKFYSSVNLAQVYPGLRALSFIAKVNTKDLPAFVAVHRADTSLNPHGNPTFTVSEPTSLPVHYVVTYSVNSSPSGADLGSTPGRLAAFEKAEATRQAVSSGTLNFPASNGTPAQNGFFVTIPVVDEASKGAVVGFVNAIFNYKDFFNQAFAHESLRRGINVAVRDTEESSSIYVSNQGGATTRQTYSYATNIQVADRAWDMHVSAPANFGVSQTQQAIPRAVLGGGQLFSLLLIIIFILQARARRQALNLADLMTEDLQRERNLATANDQKSSAILASIGDGVFAVDTKGLITLFNPAAVQISGMNAADAVGRHYEEVLHFAYEATGKPNYKFVHTALGGRPAAMDNHTVLVRTDGLKVPVADSAAPIHDENGRIQGAIIVFRDVTKEYELDKAKNEFVSLASHQLRTPLSAINWFGEMLLGGDAGKLDKRQEEYIRQMFESSKRMVDLVNSLLNVSRLEVGKLPDKPSVNDLATLIASLKTELGGEVATKQITWTEHLAKLPNVTADPNQLRMVIQNLLSNAVKYTPAKGSVSLTLRRATPEDLRAAKLRTSEPHWYFSVKDTGYGIPKTQQDRIFEKLYRADNVRKLNVEGTGLGLYIVKEVVQKMGGSIWFDSIENNGATFCVVLPFKTKQTATPHDTIKPAEPGEG